MKVPRNRDGLSLIQWLRAAGWDWPLADIISHDRGATFEQLAASWSNGANPEDWKGTAR